MGFLGKLKFWAKTNSNKSQERVSTTSLNEIENPPETSLKKFDMILNKLDTIENTIPKKTAQILEERKLALEKELEALQKAKQKAFDIQQVSRAEKTKELLGKVVAEKYDKTLSAISSDIAQNMILKYLQKEALEKGALDVAEFKYLIVEKEKICSRATFFRHLKDLEERGLVSREKKGRKSVLKSTIVQKTEKKPETEYPPLPPNVFNQSQ